jgi:hypothetical protein
MDHFLICSRLDALHGMERLEKIMRGLNPRSPGNIDEDGVDMHHEDDDPSVEASGGYRESY